MKLKRIFSTVLVLALLLGAAPLTGINQLSVFSYAEETTDSTEHLMEVPEGYTGVYTKDDLDYIKLDMSGKYILMNDIVFEDSDFVKGGDFYNSGKGWEPIGTSSTQFKGTFDGNGYSIKNLYINDTAQYYMGLFGYVSYATIKNVTMENCDITGRNYTGGIVGFTSYSTTVSNCNVQGTVNGSDYVGGIVGYVGSSSTVSDCNVQGTVNGSDYVGGIVGDQNSGKILRCNNAAEVKGSNYVGGIAGISLSGSSGTDFISIGYCSNSGSVTATGYRAGGIVGASEGNSSSSLVRINYCYNCGDVSAQSYAGGLMGEIGETNVKHCYSVGTVTAESNLGGCLGMVSNFSYITFCYYLDEGVTNPTCTSGTPKSEDQLRRATAYEQWDFKTIWTMKGREDYRYPELIDVPLILPEDFIEHEHSYTSEITTPATHLATGVMTYTCECGDSYTEEIPKTEQHSYETVVTAPTCTEQGYTTYTCECGDSYVDDYVNATGHNYLDGKCVCGEEAETPSNIQSITYVQQEDTHKTFSVTCNGRASMIQFMEPDGGTRTYDRYNKNVTITGYNAKGEKVSSMSRDLAYEVWEIYTNLSVGTTVKLRAKFSGKWEADKRTLIVDEYNPVISIELSAYSGKKGAVPATVVADEKTEKVMFKMPNGTSVTVSAYTTDENGNHVFTGKAWMNEDGVNTINVFIRRNDVWKSAGSLEYTVE